jgi:DNA-directed RNA polymerase subunit alpha
LVCDKESLTETYGQFVAEPFERGFGTTIGNSLRRVLLSSIEGAAIATVKVEGVDHEFSSIPGVVEDVTDIILNLKRLLVKLHSDEPKKIRIEKKGKGPVVAGDIAADATVEIVNPDIQICTLADDRELALELEVRKGRGYVTAAEHDKGEQEIGVIPIDCIFSPVQRVRYRTEYTRVGQLTNYDRLILEVWTDGTVSPEMAIVEASKILRKHLTPFINYFELGKELQREEAKEETREDDGILEALREQLMLPISELDLSVRASNCLQAENIMTIRDLVSRSEPELLKVRNFGKTSLREIKKKLTEMGLSLGMEIAKFLGEN